MLLPLHACFYLYLLSINCFSNSNRLKRHQRATIRGTQPGKNPNNAITTLTLPPSIINWDLTSSVGHITITSMSVDQHRDTRWYVPSYHAKYSSGWNRTVGYGFLAKPLACHIRFFGVGLEETIQGYAAGGTGYIQGTYTSIKKQTKESFGITWNDTLRQHCYYMTNNHYGSDFVDTPKTFGIAIYCPVMLDQELGEYSFQKEMIPGKICRKFAENSLQLKIILKPTDTLNENYDDSKSIEANIVTNPDGARKLLIYQELNRKSNVNSASPTIDNNSNDNMKVTSFDDRLPRRHAVCAVLTFRNPLTVYQLALPSKYNSSKGMKEEDFQFKTFYNFEKKGGYVGNLASDTADQDMDKTRTYDHCRLEYSHLKSILYIDPDELLYCPLSTTISTGFSSQRDFQRSLMDKFSVLGVQEMRFVRLPYAARLPLHLNLSVDASVSTTLSTTCMQAGYNQSDIKAMLSCWSSASSYDEFVKSSDFAGVCPFHYNHWSCDGMRGGGRDSGDNIPRCRCKVSFDMTNGQTYRPNTNRCHLMHLHDSKYRLQARRMEMKKTPSYNTGNVHELNPAVKGLF